MDTFFDIDFSNPLYLSIMGFLIIVITYSIIKRIIKLIFLCGFLLICYLFYLGNTGKEVPRTVENIKTSFFDSIHQVRNLASESLDGVKKTTKKIVEEKVDEKVKEIFDN